MAFSLGAVVSCKDYDDDINALEGDVAALQDALDQLNGAGNLLTENEFQQAVADATGEQISSLKGAIEALIAAGGASDAIKEQVAAQLEALGFTQELVAALGDQARIAAMLDFQDKVLAALKANGFEGEDALNNAFKAVAAARDGLGGLTPADLEKLHNLLENGLGEGISVLGFGALKSLAYVPEWYDNGNPAVLFLYLNGVPDDNDPKTPTINFNPTTDVFGMSATKDLTFRINPSHADIEEGIEWSFLNRAMKETRAADPDQFDLVSKVGDPGISGGFATFSVVGNPDERLNVDGDGVAKFDYPGLALNEDTATDTNNDGIYAYQKYTADYIALQAKNADAETDQLIASDYIKTWFKQSYAFIGDKKKWDNRAKDNLRGEDIRNYDFSRALQHLKGGLALTPSDVNADIASTMPGAYPLDSISFSIPYITNGKPTQVKLDTLVFASVWDENGGDYGTFSGKKRITMDEAGFKDYYYEFENVSWTPNEEGTNTATTDPTDQSYFISNPTKANGNVVEVLQGTAAINRTPIFKVNLRSGGANDLVLATHWFKVQITEAPIVPISIPPIVVYKPIGYLDLYTALVATPGKPGIPATGRNAYDKYYNVASGSSYYGVAVTGDGATDRKYALASDVVAEGAWSDPHYTDSLLVTWEKMNAIYTQLGVSHQQFINNYNDPMLSFDRPVEHDVMNPHALLADKGIIDFTSFQAGQNTGTVPVQIYIHPETRFGKHTWYVNFTPKATSSYPALKIPVEFSLAPPSKPAFNPNYVANSTTANAMTVTKGKILSTDNLYHMQATFEESFYMQPWVNAVVDSIVPISDATNKMMLVAANAGVNVEGYGTTVPWAAADFQVTGYQTHVFAFDFSATGKDSGWVPSYNTTTANDATNEKGETIANAGQIDAVTAPSWPSNTGSTQPAATADQRNVYNFRGQDIMLKKPISDDQWTFNVVFRSTYENMEVVDIRWKFQFQNPIELALKPIELATEGQPDVKSTQRYVDVKFLGEPIVTSGYDNLVDTTLAKRYSVGGAATNPADTVMVNKFTWAINYTLPLMVQEGITAGDGTTGVDALYFSSADATKVGSDDVYDSTVNYYGTANTTPYNSIFWQNAGSKLLNDLPLKDAYSVTVSAGSPTPYATRTASSDITLKKTTMF